jgi:hypothetical protein
LDLILVEEGRIFGIMAVGGRINGGFTSRVTNAFTLVTFHFLNPSQAYMEGL